MMCKGSDKVCVGIEPGLGCSFFHSSSFGKKFGSSGNTLFQNVFLGRELDMFPEQTPNGGVADVEVICNAVYIDILVQMIINISEDFSDLIVIDGFIGNLFFEYR